MKKVLMNKFVTLLFTVCVTLLLSFVTASAAADTSVKILKVGKTYTIKNTSKVTSSKENVASTAKKSSTKYTVTALKKGRTTLKVYNKGKVSKKVYLLAYKDNSFKYDTSAITMKVGKTKKVQATVQNGCTVKYKSTDKSIAKVNSKGKITAVSAGNVIIKAKVYYKDILIKTLKKQVTVTDASSSVVSTDAVTNSSSTSESKSGASSSSASNTSGLTNSNSNVTANEAEVKQSETSSSFESSSSSNNSSDSSNNSSSSDQSSSTGISDTNEKSVSSGATQTSIEETEHKSEQTTAEEETEKSASEGGTNASQSENTNAGVCTHNWECIDEKASTCIENGCKYYKCLLCSEAKEESIPATGIHDYVIIDLKPASCVDGWNLYKCSMCGDSYTEIVYATRAHDYYETSRVEATCTENGEIVYTCETCGKSYSESIQAGHYFEEILHEPSCTESGYTEYTCTICNESYKNDWTSALGHNYVIADKQEALCDKDGYVVYTCERCQDSYTEPLEALGHTYIAISNIDVTCTTDGYITYECNVCGDTYNEIDEKAVEHQFDIVDIQQPTCVDAGFTKYTCSKCGTTNIGDIVLATGKHDYEESWNDATCVADGHKSYTCRMCGYSYETDTPALGHDYIMSEVDPTCTKQGYTLHECTRCTEMYVSDFIEAKGHTFAGGYCIVCGIEEELVAEECIHNWEMTGWMDSTCIDAGYATFECTLCHETYSITIPETGMHNYITANVLDATCGTNGLIEYQCSVCGDSYTEVFPASNEHNYVSQVIQEATCTKDGILSHTCTVCGTSYTETIVASGHDFEEYAYAVSCTQDGYVSHICKNCGFEYIDNKVNALGHKFALIQSVEPTCDCSGSSIYECSNGCGTVYSENVLSPLGHDWQIVKTVEASCTEDGCAMYICNRCGTEYTEFIERFVHDFSDGVCIRCGSIGVIDNFDSYYTPTKAQTINAGNDGIVSVFYPVESDEITFEMSADNADIKTIVADTTYDGWNESNCYYARVTFVGRIEGSCSLYIYYNGELFGTVSITVNGTDQDYFDYLDWKEELEHQLWDGYDLTDLQKIVKFGDYVFARYPYADYSSKYGYMQDIGGDCIASSSLLIDVAKDLGYSGELFAPYESQGNYNHKRARIYMSDGIYTMEASNNSFELYGETCVWGPDGLIIYLSYD